jgi:hypothetical protein
MGRLNMCYINLSISSIHRKEGGHKPFQCVSIVFTRGSSGAEARVLEGRDTSGLDIATEAAGTAAESAEPGVRRTCYVGAGTGHSAVLGRSVSMKNGGWMMDTQAAVDVTADIVAHGTRCEEPVKRYDRLLMGIGSGLWIPAR